MASSTANITTESASRYLQQLCKHWGHRFAVTFDPSKGSIDFGSGQSVDLSASDTALSVTVHDEKDARLPELEQVVADHLRRFAFRETLEFDWSRQG